MINHHYCTLQRNPVPMGWGDHVRWMHETDDWSRAAGARWAQALRGGNELRAALTRGGGGRRTEFTEFTEPEAPQDIVPYKGST